MARPAAVKGCGSGRMVSCRWPRLPVLPLLHTGAQPQWQSSFTVSEEKHDRWSLPGTRSHRNGKPEHRRFPGKAEASWSGAVNAGLRRLSRAYRVTIRY